MEFSQQGINLLKKIEQMRLKPYDDQTGKTITEWCQGATVGYGYLISKEEWPLYQNGITKEQADILFDKTIKPYVATVNKGLTSKTKQTLLQNQFDALVIFCYNIGEPKFLTSSVLKIVNGIATKYPSITEAFMAWNKSQGVVNTGLINRRKCELNVYKNNIYQW